VIAVIDYGGGNTGSLMAALRAAGSDAMLTGDPAAIGAAAAAILPGDGAFAATMNALRDRGLLPAIAAFIQDAKPFLGICVGMQILYEAGDEFGEARGLGIFAGRISRFTGSQRVPHMGWSKIEVVRPAGMMAGIGDDDYAYFMHSYRAPVTPDTVAIASNEGPFTAVAARGNVWGMQFHPEKSQRTGARLLRNFVAGARKS